MVWIGSIWRITIRNYWRWQFVWHRALLKHTLEKSQTNVTSVIMPPLGRTSYTCKGHHHTLWPPQCWRRRRQWGGANRDQSLPGLPSVTNTYTSIYILWSLLSFKKWSPIPPGKKGKSFPKMVFVGESFPRMVCVGGVCQGFVSRERWFVSEGWSWTTCDKSKGFDLYIRLYIAWYISAEHFWVLKRNSKALRILGLGLYKIGQLWKVQFFQIKGFSSNSLVGEGKVR